MKIFSVYAGEAMRKVIVSGLAIRVCLDEQDDCTVVNQAFLIVNDGDEVELDLSLDDNQTLVYEALSDRVCYPVFGVCA